MSFLNPLHPIESGIIEILASRVSVNVKDIKIQLKSDFEIDASIQNIYRIVGSLTEKQVLVRKNNEITLNLMWVNHLLRFSESIKRAHLMSPKNASDLPVVDGEEIVLGADSLSSLDPIWNHILIEISQSHKGESFFAYNSHAWYPLGMQTTERQLFRTLYQADVNCTMLYGHDSFLDQRGMRLARLEEINAHCANPSLLDVHLQRDDLLVWIAGDYVILCEMPQILARHFSFFFEIVKKVDQFDIEMFSQLFELRARSEIKVMLNRIKAKEWRQRIEEGIRVAAA